MRERIAEWILSLVLPPARAAAAVGDFAEQAEKRGGYWFWSEIFRTVTSLVWRDLAGNPGFWASLALRAWIFSTVSFFAVIVVVIPIVTTPLLMLFVGVTGMAIPTPPFSPVLLNLFAVAGLVEFGLTSYWAGRWLGRRAPNREFAAAVATTLIPMLVMNVVVFVVMEMWGKEIESWAASQPAYESGGYNPGYFLSNLFFAACLFAGAIRARRNSSRGATQ